VTETRTAAAIVGQGALATLNQATWATQITGTGKPEDYATKSVVYRQATAPASGLTVNDIWVQLDGSGNATRVFAWTGSAWQLGADITGINTAAAISGQGTLATLKRSDMGVAGHRDWKARRLRKPLDRLSSDIGSVLTKPE